MMEDEDFSDEFRRDEYGLIDLDYNKARFIHFFGQEAWDKAMKALDKLNETPRGGVKGRPKMSNMLGRSRFLGILLYVLLSTS